MLQAQIYYYPSGFGHIGVNIIFDKEDIPPFWQNKEIEITLLSENSWGHSDNDKQDTHTPGLISKGNGEYSVWGYKNHRWQETPLTDLSMEEHEWLETLNFPTKGYSYHSIKTTLPPSMHPLIQRGHPDLIRKEYFFDWGGAYDFDDNSRNRGEPLRIDLPPANISWKDFWGAAEELGRDSYSRYHGQDPYNLFTNNCAHSTLDLLYCAGYTSEKPDASIDLFPIVAAIKASRLANQHRSVFKKQLIEHKKQHNETQLINTLIQLSCNRLQETIHLSFGNLIGECAPELARLEAIKFDGSPESIERLLLASEMTNPHTQTELSDCIALVEPQQCLVSCLARLDTIATQLKDSENQVKLQNIATCLHQELENFQANNTSHEQFSKNCSELIEQARPILEGENSLLLQVLKNIAIAVCGLVVFYLAAAFINKANTGNFLFFNEPALSVITDTMQSSIENLIQHKPDPELSMTL